MSYTDWMRIFQRRHKKRVRAGKRTRSARAVRKALRLETLESRLAMSVTIVSGDIVITGSDANDVVSVLTWATHYEVRENGISTRFPLGAVTGGDVRFTGKGGNDFFSNSTTLN